MVEQLQTFGTELTADSVETTPLAPHVLCCATYQLEQSTGKRLGCIQAYEFVSQTGAAAEADEGDTGAERAEATPPQLRHRQTLRTRSGVLDTKWSRGPLGPGGTPLLAAVLADGTFDLFRLRSRSRSPSQEAEAEAEAEAGGEDDVTSLTVLEADIACCVSNEKGGGISDCAGARHDDLARWSVPTLDTNG